MVAMSNKKLPPELVEKYKKLNDPFNSEMSEMHPFKKAEACAQIAVDYAEEVNSIPEMSMREFMQWYTHSSNDYHFNTPVVEIINDYKRQLLKKHEDGKE